MPFTTEQNMVINALSSSAAIAEAKNWWSFMNGGVVADNISPATSSPSVIAHPKYVVSGGGRDAHFLFSFSEAPVEVDGAYSVKDAVSGRPGYGMDDDLSPAAGKLVNCWDPDATKRGRYQKVGASGTGSWVLVASEPADKMWVDYNHPQRLLELAICSFVKTAEVPAFMGGQQGWQGKANGDWRNARLTLDIEFQQAKMGPYAKFGMHCQSSVAELSEALSAEYPESPNPKYILSNQMLRSTISDPLGFGYDSMDLPNDVPVVRASGRKLVVLNLSTDDADWVRFGDPGRSPTGRLVNYNVAPIADVLENLVGNIYLLAHHPKPKSGADYFAKSSDETIPDNERFRGNIRLYGWKIESFA